MRATKKSERNGSSNHDAHHGHLLGRAIKKGTFVKGSTTEVPLSCCLFSVSPFPSLSFHLYCPIVPFFLHLFTRVHVVDPHTLLAADVAAQWKMQWHFSLRFSVRVLWPRPQHNKSQPSMPCDDTLQTRVPGAKRARLRVRLTEVGRSLVVHQVSFCGVLEEGVFGP